MRRKFKQPEAGVDAAKFCEMAAQVRSDIVDRHRLIKTGGLPAFRLGADWRFRRADLEIWIARQRVQAGGSGQPKDRDPTAAKAKKPSAT